MKTQLKQEVENRTEETALLNDKIARLEKARNELEAEIEKVVKQKTMFEQMIAELTEDLAAHERKTRQC